MSAKNSKDGFAQEPAGEETLAMRFLIDDPDKGWRVISAKRVLAAQRGELLIPELADRMIRVAYADVGVRSGQLVALLSVTLAEWRMDAGGRVDRAGLTASVLEKLDHGGAMLGKNMGEHSLQPSQADLDAMRKALGLQRA